MSAHGARCLYECVVVWVCVQKSTQMEHADGRAMAVTSYRACAELVDAGDPKHWTLTSKY